MEYDFTYADTESRAKSLTDGCEDHRYFLWVPNFLSDSEEKEYLVLFNTGDAEDYEFEIRYRFVGDYCREKSCFAISGDGKTAVVGYKAKKGVVCYDCENGKVSWNNTSIKKVLKIEFNNFEPDIIVVTTDKLKRCYLDRRTGELLDPEKAATVRQVVHHMRVSKNGKYLMIVDHVAGIDKGIYTVYDTETKEVKGSFAAQDSVGRCNFDISDDGELAVCAAYQKQGVSLIKVASGEVVWTQKSIKNIYLGYIDKKAEAVIVYCQYDGIYFLDMKTGDIQKSLDGEKICFNAYGEDILFPDRKNVSIGKEKITTPTFSWLLAIGTREGILLQPAGEAGLRLYDPKGKLLWKNDFLCGTPAYQPDDERIITYSFMDPLWKIQIASAKDGSILAEKEIDAAPCAYLSQQKAVLCCTGKMYDVSGGSIEEEKEIFALIAGN